MNNIFKSTPLWQLALLTVVGIVSSGYMAASSGAPILRAALGNGAWRLATPRVASSNPRVSGIAAPSKGDQTNIVASLRSQVASLVSRVSQLESARRDVVLGASDESTGQREEFPPAVNLLRNSSYEESSDGAPRQWSYQYDSNSGNTKTSAEAIRTGTQGLKFVGGGTGNFGLSQPGAKTVERRSYALSVWVKPVNSDSHTIKLSFWDEVANKEASSKVFNLSGTKEWSRLVFQVDNRSTFNGKKWFPMFTVNGLADGALYIDDAQLEEANSYTPYHFVGGGATQSHVSILGDGSVEVDAHGNIYPAVNGIGSLGTGDNKFSELRLSKASITKDGDLNLDGGLTVNGNSTLKGTVGFPGTIASDFIPDLDSTYNLGSTTKKWKQGYIDGLYLKNGETIGNGTDGEINFVENSTGGSNTLIFDLNVAADAIELRNDTEDLRLRAAGDGNLVLRAGDGATNSNVNGNDLFLAAEDAMTLRSATYSLQTSGSTITMTALNSGITLSTGSDSQGSIQIKSAGSLILDTTLNNTDINILAGNSTSTSLTLRSDRGGIDLSTSSASGAGDLRLRAAGTLQIDTTASDTNILVIAGGDTSTTLALRSDRGGIDLSSSQASGSGDVRIRSAGTLQLDTSAANSNILARTGTGRIDLASGGTGTGATAAITLASTNGGIDLSTSGVAGNGNLSLRSAGTLTLDTTASDTDINILAGNSTSTSLTLRSDRGGIDLSSSSASGAGDIRIRSAGTLHLDTSATGASILAKTGSGQFSVSAGQAASNAISLLATNGGVDVSTSGLGGNGNLVLRSAGNLQIDTSANDTDILVLAGGASSTTLALRSDRGGIDLSSSSASGSGDIKIRAAGTLTLDTSANNANIIANTGTGRLVATSNATGTGSTAGISLLTTNGGIDVSTSGVGGNGNLTLRAGGNLLLDASGNRNNIDILAGGASGTSLTVKSVNGGIDISSGYASGSGDIIVRSGGSVRIDTSGSGLADAKSNNIILNSGGRGGGATGSAIMLQANNGAINLSTGNGTGNGDIALRSGGSLVLDTSSKNGGVNIFTGSGNVGINQTALTQYTLDVSGTGRFVCTNNFANASKSTYCSDVAEAYETNDSSLTPGDVLVVDRNDSTKVAKSVHAYQGIIGVYSTSPGLLVGGETILGTSKMVTGDNRVPVAMVGRVPVKVTNETGPIKIGDRLVSSSTQGSAMRAVKQGVTLGIALEGATFADRNTTTILTYVNVSWYFPEVITELERQYELSDALGIAPNTNAVLAAAVSTTAGEGTSNGTTSAFDLAQGAVLGTATTIPDLRVAIPPTEFPNIAVTNALTVGKQLTVSGTSRFEGEVVAVADVTFQKNVIVVGNLRIGGLLEVAGAVVTQFSAGSSVAAGDPVSVNADGSVSRSSGGRAVIGVASSNAASGEKVNVAVAGKVSGLSGLSTGARYFVNAAGVLTTEGKGGQALGVAVSSTELLVQPGVGLPSESSPPASGSTPEPTTTSTSATTVSPTPSVEATVTPTPIPTVTVEPTPTSTATPTPTPTPTP